MENLSTRTTAFLIRSRLSYSIYDLCRYIDNNHKAIDCNEIKKHYACIADNGSDVKKILVEYLLEIFEQSIDTKKEVPDNIDIESMINENIDIFFDITEGNDCIYIEDAYIS